MITYCLLALCIICLNPASGVIDEQKVDDVINQALKCHPQNPGLTVSIVKNGNTILAKGYGVKDIVSKQPVTNTTIFQLASLSKAFAATLLMQQLHQNKSLSIYSHVADILGHNFQFSTDIRTHNANLRDLLSHNLGIPRHNSMRLDPTLTRATLPRLNISLGPVQLVLAYYFFLKPSVSYTEVFGKASRHIQLSSYPTEWSSGRIKYLKSIYPFRESFLYNNLMYGLITEISENLGGKKWEDLIAEVIYQPLGMTSSTFATRINPSSQIKAQGYTNDDETGGVQAVPFELNRRYSEMCGSTCVMSTALDMTKWMNFHLSGGKNQAGHQIVDAKSLSYIYRPRNTIMSSTVGKYFTKPMTPVTTTETTYGFGWKIGYYRGYPILRHTGTTWGYSSLITLIPDMNIGVFTSMTGQDHNYIFRSLLHNYLSDMALGVTPWLNRSTICTFPEPWYSQKTTSHPSVAKNRPLYRTEDQYIGKYVNDAYGSLTISHNSTLNRLQMTYGYGSWALYPEKTHDQFYGEGLGLMKKTYDLNTIKFHTNNANQITNVEVTSFELKDPPVFTKQAIKPVFG